MTKVTVKKNDIVYRLAAIIESQSAAISPRTNEIIEASRTAKEEIERLRQNIREFLEILDRIETTDEGREFHPTTIHSCRVEDTQKLNFLLSNLRKQAH